MLPERLIQTAIDSFGRIDILVNVAGAFGFSPIEKMSEELWDKVTLVKPKGYFNTMRHAVPHMIKQKWGRIINCTSRAFLGDVIKHTEYCAANAGVVGLTKAVAIELHKYGITCNAFSPWALTRASYELDTYSLVVDKEDRPFIFEMHVYGGRYDENDPDVRTISLLLSATSLPMREPISAGRFSAWGATASGCIPNPS